MTIRLWGSDANENRLVLFCEGLQVGYRHLGDIESLDVGRRSRPARGRFFYRTAPLPRQLTRGKREVQLEIRSTGPIWNYATNFAQYQRKMTEPTRGIYRVYSHLEGYFTPPAEERQGTAPADPPVRATPGPEALEQLKAHVSKTIQSVLNAKRPLTQMEAHFLAKAYHVKWTPAYHEPKVIAQVTRGVDALYAAWKKDEKAMTNDASTPNPGWFGAGPAGKAVQLLAGPLQPALDQTLIGNETRRAQWAELFVASREWLRAAPPPLHESDDDRGFEYLPLASRGAGAG